MRATILAAGTEGDIQPLLAVGRGLRERGHEVRFATPPIYHDLVRGSGLEPHRLGDYDPRRVSIDIVKGNPRRSRLVVARRRLTPAPSPKSDLADMANACVGADAVIYPPIAGLAYHAAEARGVPAFEVQLVPLAATRAFPSPHVPIREGMGPRTNWLSHHLVSGLSWAVNRAWVNDWRRSLGLGSLSLIGPVATRFFREKHFVLCAVSPSVIPLPADWPETARVTGYLFAPADHRAPPSDLVDFLAAGPPPVCVSFGSTVEIRPDALRPVLEDAHRRSGQRFVYVKGWANYELPAPSRDVFVVERASYPWLFARSLAVVHHAGTGTAAEVVRAGVPSVCVPHITEQRFWSTRLTALGVAPPQIPRRDLSASRLAHAIERASSPEMRERTRALGARVQAEDGISNAVDVIENVVLRSSKTHPASTAH